MIEFPQELIDEILDHLADDFRSLKTCSLVCRAWVPRSRSYLFETCTLVPNNVLFFHELLHFPGCTFLPHIRSIEASRYYWSRYERYFDAIAADVCRLTNVYALEMMLSVVVNSRNADTFFRAGFATAFPHVTRLILTCDLEGEPAPLVDMICLFTALQELHIRHERSCTPLTTKPSANAVPPRGLRILRLSVHFVDLILTWLLAFKQFLKVESLVLPLLQSQHASIVRATLRQLGGAVCDLEITLKELSVDPITVFDLSLHPNLKTLIIRGSSRVNNLITSSLVAPALESLSLDFNTSLYQGRHWETMDAFLISARFPRLHKVVFRCRNSDDGNLYTALPLLRATGVLQIEW
ncbi:hypothetical protein B0H13DRAFT_716833 [Mycena leptocephala]|nr:hypothetical protein B0H13DRAFT_716833 [Mycena leptocephala]